MKGIILAGGKGTRLYPVTKAISKQILPIYDKPMIYYPLSVLMLADIREILLISTARDLPMYMELLGDGRDLGLNIEYKVQDKPRGLAEAFIIGEQFIRNDSVALILGDNIFFGQGFSDKLIKGSNVKDGAIVFGYYVKNPQEFGVVEFDKYNKVLSLEEKPVKPKSHYAIPGLYFYDNDVVRKAGSLKPSKRGELEITDLNRLYLDEKKLSVEILGRGLAWLDTGTYDGLLEAGIFVETIQKRQGLYVACIEEIAYKKGWISKEQLISLAEDMAVTDYGKYLLRIAEGD